MAYDRYGNNESDRDSYNRSSSDRDDRGTEGYGTARDYRSAGDLGGYGRDNARGYGQRDAGRSDYDNRDQGQGSYGRRSYGQQDFGQREGGDHDGGNARYSQGRGGLGEGDRGRQGFTGGSDYYRGDDRQGRDYGNYGRDPYRQSRGTFDRQPQSYGRDADRGFLDRAGDEVRSWFGDEDAERRRERDARADERQGGHPDRDRDDHYRHWRNQQVASFDRDYDEYRQENRAKFHNEFHSWRTERQGQRDLLGQVKEHAEVVGSDGEHVGTVDKVRGDNVILTKSDQDAGGKHHSFPSRWIRSVDAKVTLTKTAAEAKQQWQDAERQGALFGDPDRGPGEEEAGNGSSLNRNYSGTGNTY